MTTHRLEAFERTGLMLDAAATLPRKHTAHG